MLTRVTLFLFALAATLLIGGCAVPDAARTTAETAAAGNDRYTTLASMAFDGSATIAEHGIAPVSSEDLAATPEPVQVLLDRLLNSLHVNRLAWHSLLFQLDLGPDPETLGLTPLALPAGETDDLLEDN